MKIRDAFSARLALVILFLGLFWPAWTPAQTHVYDALGRVIWSTQAGGAATVYGYDPNGNLLSIAHIAPGIDVDSDGLPDSFELFYTSGASAIAISPEIDEEKDGLINLLEFALAREPFVCDARALTPVSIVPGAGNQYLTIQYRRPKQGTVLLDYQVEVSTDLAGGVWSSAAADVEQISRADQGGGIELVTVRAKAGVTTANKMFLRLRVTKLP